MSEPGRRASRPVLRVIRGGDPTPEQVAAIAATLQMVVAAPAAGDTAGAVPSPSEWALNGRMRNLNWEPLAQRWPGEGAGESWRRVID